MKLLEMPDSAAATADVVRVMTGSVYEPTKLGAAKLWAAQTTDLERPERWDEGRTMEMKRTMVTAEMRGSAAAMTEGTGTRLGSTTAATETGAE